MKVAIIAKKPEYLKDLKRHLERHKLEFVEKDPDIVISAGGDGTYLLSERTYPGIPKILLRKESICRRCYRYTFEDMEDILNKLEQNEYIIEENTKLLAEVNGKKLAAINDIVIRNNDQFHCIRFRVEADGEPINGLMIGDGVVISTPFGSTAYYYAISKNTFDKGIGLAFNNLMISQSSKTFDENAKIKFKLIRGNALLSADNNEKMIELKDGDEVTISKAECVAKIIKIKDVKNGTEREVN